MSRKTTFVLLVLVVLAAALVAGVMWRSASFAEFAVMWRSMSTAPWPWPLA